MSYLSFFRKSVLERFWLLQEAGKLWETAQAGAITSDVFPSPPSHAVRHRGILTLHLFPVCSSSIPSHVHLPQLAEMSVGLLLGCLAASKT